MRGGRGHCDARGRGKPASAPKLYPEGGLYERTVGPRNLLAAANHRTMALGGPRDATIYAEADTAGAILRRL